jgi:hypothetical protein
VRTRLFLATFTLALGVSAHAQQTTAAGGTKERGVRILVNGLYNPTGISFTDTFTFDSYLEDGRTTTSHEGGKGFVFEAGAIVGIWEDLGVMGSLEFYQTDFDGAFEQSLPHPLYFGRPRAVSGDVAGLEYSEKAIHVDAVFTREFPSVTVDVFGGPSFFFASAELLESVETSSEYPFDEAAVRSTTTRTFDENPIGFNAGGAVTVKLTDVIGVAFQARYSYATIKISREGSEDVELDAGGFRVGGGLRISF